MLRFLRRALLLLVAFPLAAAESPVRSYEGTVTIPTYEHSARETEPPLFTTSTVTGMYPFTTYLMPYKAGPNPRTYPAIFVENEYLKLTYIPEFGARFFSVFDKLRNREVFYRNDVIKPAPYNPRNSWPQSGMELTGPHDLHTLTLYSEPYWSNKIVHDADGAIALVLGETDPVYGMRVDLSATLHPGVAAIEIKVFCYNGRDGRKPQMFWINSAISATPQTRFTYPMSRTVGHTTADVADWPLYNGNDYSLDRNNKHMLGVFGIDIYDNFQGAYQFDRDYGIFRYADRRIVQGMKMWTFGYGEGSKTFERGYTDNAGPYVELQSGRHVWDGHYEWVAPHEVESWSEWWIPVAATGGLTTLTRDVALKLDVDKDSGVKLVLGATRIVTGATLTVTAKSGQILHSSIDLDPATPVHAASENYHVAVDALTSMVVQVTDKDGHLLLDYHRPDADPGRKEYTPFTKPLEEPHKAVEDMSVEELTLAAEYQLKELDEAGAQALFDKALAKDPGYSRAHLLLGITAFNDGRYDEATKHLAQAIKRDAYADFAYYYLAMSELAQGMESEAERNLYYIWPDSAYYGDREYQLGRLTFTKLDVTSAAAHFRRAIAANAYDLYAHVALAVVSRECGDATTAASELSAVASIDPANPYIQAERWLQTSSSESQEELLRLMGAQTQEAMGMVPFYRNLHRWKDAAKILKLVGDHNRDPYGTTPEFYYTLAYCERRAGDAEDAAVALKLARAARGHVDRFPYREESEAPLSEAVQLDTNDVTARFDLGCLLYFRGKAQAAIAQWEAAVALAPKDFSLHRALGLAYAEQGVALANGVEKAAAQLERAVELNPTHLRTLDDLSALYARAGRFDEQLAVLNKGLKRSPADDDLAEGVLAADLNKGLYGEAEHLINAHTFAPRHRTYTLRDKYRVMHYGLGAEAFNRGDFAHALPEFQTALNPPVSLGTDDFQTQATPRIDYYIGRTLEAMGNTGDAEKVYERAIAGVAQLSGDRDSWNSENFFMVLALERLGRTNDAQRLEKHFANFAATERDSTNSVHRSEARYLLALISKHDGQPSEAHALLTQALEARPDLIAARLELRGDVLDPLTKAP